MAHRPRILSISFSEFSTDARVLRQLQVLRDFGDVTTIGYGTQPEGATEHLELSDSLASLPQTLGGIAGLMLRQHERLELAAPAAAKALQLLRGRRFDLIVANEARALPLAHAVAAGAPVWGDMHEWAPEERTHVLTWRLLIAPFMRYICAKYLPRTDAVTTVNASIAELYNEQFGCRTRVVRNAIPLQPLEPSDVPTGHIRLVHSGSAVPGRALETLIEATLALDDRFTLDFYLMGARDGGKYLQKLKRSAGSSRRIRFHDAVAPHQLPATLNAYDVGIYSIPPQTINHKYMLPNKFFDFTQARLALVFGPSVETSTLIDGYGLGIVADDFSVNAMVKALGSLTEERVRSYKKNTHAAAPQLSSEEDEAVQRAVVTGLLASK